MTSFVGNPDAFLAKVAEHKEWYVMDVCGAPHIVYPGVFSPAYSNSWRFFVRHMHIEPSMHVLDMGCGTGILGITSLRRGARFCTFADVNFRALENVKANLQETRFHNWSRVRTDGMCVTGIGYDVILFNPPYWNRCAETMLERSCFDDGYAFTADVIRDGKWRLRSGGVLYICGTVGTNEQIVEEKLRAYGWKYEKTVETDTDTRFFICAKNE